MDRTLESLVHAPPQPILSSEIFPNEISSLSRFPKAFPQPCPRFLCVTSAAFSGRTGEGAAMARWRASRKRAETVKAAQRLRFTLKFRARLTHKIRGQACGYPVCLPCKSLNAWEHFHLLKFAQSRFATALSHGHSTGIPFVPFSIHAQPYEHAMPRHRISRQSRASCLANSNPPPSGISQCIPAGTTHNGAIARSLQ